MVPEAGPPLGRPQPHLRSQRDTEEVAHFLVDPGAGDCGGSLDFGEPIIHTIFMTDYKSEPYLFLQIEGKGKTIAHTFYF